ncbi:hypothetical protein K1719_027950 [Acacia pycnantha]|nr:hypothetical protein K1719_027950 [Acacia pycnantha]
MLFPPLHTQKLTPERQRPNKRRLANICIVKSILEASSFGQLSQAVSSLDLLIIKGIRLPSRILGHLLQQCAETKSFREGVGIT